MSTAHTFNTHPTFVVQTEAAGVKADVVLVIKAFIFCHTKQRPTIELQPEFAMLVFQQISIVLLTENHKTGASLSKCRRPHLSGGSPGLTPDPPDRAVLQTE